jgi:uncharacterized protein (DUF3820 family)
VEELKITIGTEKNPILVDFKTYEGRKIVDIRKFYLSSSSSKEYLPTKKGISLNMLQLNELLAKFRENKDSI